ncbi:hypothetical protein [Nonomuraea sp. B19D2]|uniref:hypothetical protein n=1 Tax=Nonomuraea sp. B19D2 TaxID=3159561 RepID=UPI0032DAE832
MPVRRASFWYATCPIPSPGCRASAPTPVTCAWIGSLACLRSIATAGKPTTFRLTITQVPPAATTMSWLRSMRSGSSLMLNAYIGRRPVRRSTSSRAAVTARIRWGSGAGGQSAFTSSSLMKSTPARPSSRTRST